MEGFAYLHLCLAHEEESIECQLPEFKLDWKKPSTWIAAMSWATVMSWVSVASPVEAAIFVNTPRCGPLCVRTGPSKKYKCIRTEENGTKLPQPISTDRNYLQLTSKRRRYVYSMYVSLRPDGPRGVVVDKGNVARRSLLGGPALYDEGATGSTVTSIQRKLRNMGFYKRKNLTGYYDNATKQAVTEFQKKQGIISDGVVGPETQSYL